MQPAHREHVAREQLRMVLLHTRFGTLAATGFAVLLALQLPARLPAAQVQAWLAMKLAIALARIVLAQTYGRLDDGNAGIDAKRVPWQPLMLWLLALDGLVWGIAGWRLAGEAVPVAALGMVALDGVSCIATFGLQVRLAATAAYVLPMLLPMTARLALRSDEIAHVVAGGQLILLALLLLTARATSMRLTAGMLLRLQATQLVEEKEAALQLARERSAERDRFLAKVSHELRTPLHGMLGLTRLMHLESKDPDLTRRLELVESSGTHLQGLINDLLDASCLEAGQFTLHAQPFDLAAEIGQVADIFALRAAERGLQLHLRMDLPRPHWVHGDAARLRQVLHNLVGNAVKFTAHGSITLQAALAGADRVRIAVQDTGVGMNEAELAQVFLPFRQAEAGREADGVGLGLTIAREIAVAMGGDVVAHSRTGAGSTFVFEAVLPPVPAPPCPDAAAGASGDVAAALPKLVLVAEDDEVNALIVAAFLHGLGVRSERVRDGKQAVLRALREPARPDLVLMDCRMPVMDGVAATAEIRLQERALGLQRLPIVALTAATADADRLACLAAGMDGVIGKPFTLAQLTQALRAAVPGAD